MERDLGQEIIDASALGELHIQRKVEQARSRMKRQQQKMDDALRKSRTTMGIAGEMAAANWTWTQAPGATTRGLGTQPPGSGDGRKGRSGKDWMQPKFVGANANELSKWTNAESITRYKEELNRGQPTLRQVLKVDDEIDMKQITKSQLCALDDDPTRSGKQLRLDPRAKKRFGASYRALNWEGASPDASTVPS
mmetsp:Transcript_17494/g.40764  ORF Transcript_17494/g.40764 Transcript_17494/m.40764 type:complete len:194 (+) Transcript_17494:145-726(+)